MVNPDAQLNPKLFDPDVEQKATRDGYGEGLVIAGEADPNVVVLCADLTESTRAEAFSKQFPELGPSQLLCVTEATPAWAVDKLAEVLA